MSRLLYDVSPDEHKIVPTPRVGFKALRHLRMDFIETSALFIVTIAYTIQPKTYGTENW